MLQRILALIRKEFLALLKDPKSRMVLIVPPLLQLLIFGYAATFDLGTVTYAVYDQDRGQASRDLLAAFAGAAGFRQVVEIRADGEIEPLVDARRVLVAIHLGPRFSADLLARRPAPVQVIIDGRNSNTAMVALNYVRSIVNRFNDDWAAAHGLPAAPARLETRAWFNPNLESRWFFIPGIIGMLTLVVTMLVTALTVAREREQGTFDQLLVTPLRPGEILVGKTVPGLVIGIVQASAILLMVPAVILSGFATPIANMPRAVQLVTYVDPLRYFLIVLRKVFLEGAGFAGLLDQFWPMALIGVVTLLAAGWLFRHRMY